MARPKQVSPCGTRSTYTYRKCRCELCRAANRAYTAAVRARPVPDTVRHGTVSTYTNYNCKCAECRRANSAVKKAYYWRRRAALLAEES